MRLAFSAAAQRAVASLLTAAETCRSALESLEQRTEHALARLAREHVAVLEHANAQAVEHEAQVAALAEDAANLVHASSA